MFITSEVWLRAENDNRAFFPDDSGHFNLHDADLLFGVVLGVEGPNLSSGSRLTVSSMAQSSSIGSSASYNSNPPPPAFNQPTVNIKIIRAKMDRAQSRKICNPYE